MPKYKQIFQKMLETEKEAFDAFREIHDRYALNPEQLQEIFNKEGEKIMQIIKAYEDKLTLRQERNYSQYSGGLAEKFMELVRREFPMIDAVGLKPQVQPVFELKRIRPFKDV